MCLALSSHLIFQPNVYVALTTLAYIVDLTILIHRLSEIEVSEEHVVSILQEYAKSGEIASVNNGIRTFSSRLPSLRLEDNDTALNEFIRLIKRHHVRSGSTDPGQRR